MYDVDILAETNALGDLMKEILTVAEAQLKRFIVLPQWIPTAENRRQQAALREVRNRLNAIIEARAIHPASHTSTEPPQYQDKGDLLSMLLLARDETGLPMSRTQVLDECVTLFVAGHETTAAALTWAWYLLDRHPQVLADLQDQVHRILGARPITLESLAQMPLLEAVIKETLRLYPPAFAFGRSVQEPFHAGGVDFPKGAIILFSTYTTHRRPDLWENPEAFLPQRFLDPATHPDRYTYFPFGAGARICLGNMFAMLEAQVVLATMLQHGTLHCVDTSPVIKDTVVTLRPRDPLRMELRKNAV